MSTNTSDSPGDPPIEPLRITLAGQTYDVPSGSGAAFVHNLGRTGLRPGETRRLTAGHVGLALTAEAPC